MIYISIQNNVTCDQCGIEFHKKPSRIKNRNYCSKKCHDLAQFQGQMKTCTNCGKEIKISPSLLREHNFCSNDCRIVWLKSYVKGNINIPGHTKGHKAPHLSKLNKERNPKLALERDAVKRGDYKAKEHRKKMEEIIGRKLMPWEDVHHKNGIHSDNSPENLEVLPHSKHLKLHWKLAKERGVI